MTGAAPAAADRPALDLAEDNQHMLALVLAVRFALELALLAASAWSGYNLVGGGPPGWTVGALCAVVVASFWGVLLSPKARVTLPPAARNLVEVAVFVLVAIGLAAVGHALWGVVLIAVDVTVLLALWRLQATTGGAPIG